MKYYIDDRKMNCGRRAPAERQGAGVAVPKSTWRFARRLLSILLILNLLINSFAFAAVDDDIYADSVDDEPVEIGGLELGEDGAKPTEADGAYSLDEI